MRIHDLSVTIRTGMVTYPGDPTVHMERVASLEAGDTANLTRLDFGVHTGTHVDAPRHFLVDGSGAESLPLEALIGPCVVADATDVESRIDAAAVERLRLSPGTERVLLKTRNSDLWAGESFTENFVSLSGDGAGALVEAGIRLVGIDYLSVGDPAAHRALLGAGVVPVEGLDLRGLEPGTYQLVCLPLKIEGSDGAPARAVLIG